MDAFTDIGWFLYISLDSYKVWMHLQTLVGFCTYLLILRMYGCIHRHFTKMINSISHSIEPDKVPCTCSFELTLVLAPHIYE